jgi:hypothetical protein
VSKPKNRLIADPRTDNLGTGFMGVPICGPGGIPPEQMCEADHFMLCEECGQAFDKRDLGQVFHHNEPGHKPLVSS